MAEQLNIVHEWYLQNPLFFPVVGANVGQLATSLNVDPINILQCNKMIALGALERPAEGKRKSNLSSVPKSKAQEQNVNPKSKTQEQTQGSKSKTPE